MSTEQTVAPFVMPAPHKGQAVIYYPNGIVGSAFGTIGYVTAVGRTSIEMNVHGMLKETVSHKDDPIVRENPHVRKCGVWDFSGNDQAIDERFKQLEERIAALEAAPSKPTK